MTKAIKTIIIATVIACAIMIGCACAMPACAESKTELHPQNFEAIFQI